METPLRLLIVDDSPRDAVLLARTLTKGGYRVHFERVDTPDAMSAAVSKQPWDTALCDSRMPTFSAEAALAIWQVDSRDAPFIIVSGAIHDEEAVALLKAGAQDFVRKDNLARLAPAVARALRDAEQRCQHRLAVDALRKSEDRYANLFKGAEIAILDQDMSDVLRGLVTLDKSAVTDIRQYLIEHPGFARKLMLEQRINDANDAALRLFGVQTKEQLRRFVPELLSKLQETVFIEALCAIAGRADGFRTEGRLNSLDGKKLAVILSMPVPKTDSGFHSIPVSILDITDRRQAEQELLESRERLKYLAHHDTLTDLPNRLLFQDRLQHAMDRVRRGNKQLSVMFLDLDRFKTINDSLGHEIGDALLREFASRLQACMRESDTVARLGGDEFVIVLELVEDPLEIVIVAQRLIHALSRPFNIGRLELTVTASIGISVYPQDAQDVAGLMKCADLAMYRAKEQGRDKYHFYTPDLNKRAMELLTLENDLRKALAQGQMFIHYQPQIDLCSRQVIGMEALVRWLHPVRGLIPPAEFIPVAEDTGLILAIDTWVLRTACVQAKAFQEAGLPPLKVAVNVSARQFREPNLLGTLDDVLLETSLDPSLLEFELDESIIMTDAEGAISKLEELNQRKVGLAIDDFGTGYSSLSYLKRFPINKLKIDQSFVRLCTEDANDAAIVSAIVALASSMKLDVVAVGVESPEQWKFLRDQGVNTAQGNLFSQPLPVPEFQQFLTASSIRQFRGCSVS